MLHELNKAFELRGLGGLFIGLVERNQVPEHSRQDGTYRASVQVTSFESVAAPDQEPCTILIGQ